MASNQLSQYHIQMWYHVTCYTRDFAPVKFERLGIWPRFFIKGAQSKFLWGWQHNITQQISRKCVVDEKFVKVTLDGWKTKVLTSPQTVSISWRSLEAHQRLSWISLRRSCSKVSIVICVQTSANLQDNILISRNWVAKQWPAPKHPVRHIDLWSLPLRLRIWTLGLRSLSSSWRASCSGCFSFPFWVLKLTFGMTMTGSSGQDIPVTRESNGWRKVVFDKYFRLNSNICNKLTWHCQRLRKHLLLQWL